MRTITINENGLTDDKIDIRNSKSRAILVDGDNILVANYNGVWLLPGGSIDKGETETQAILRELREETGVDYDPQGLRKMVKLDYYQPDYPTTDGSILNRLITTFYFVSQFHGTNVNGMQRTEKEKKYGFRLELVGLDELLKRLDDKSDNPRREFFNRELREVLNAYKQEKSNEQ